MGERLVTVTAGPERLELPSAGERGKKKSWRDLKHLEKPQCVEMSYYNRVNLSRKPTFHHFHKRRGISIHTVLILHWTVGGIFIRTQEDIYRTFCTGEVNL